jgi:hypothetical protein
VRRLTPTPDAIVIFERNHPVSDATALHESQPAIAPASPLAESLPPVSPAPISALTRCVEAYDRAYRAERASRRDEIAAIRSARKAFRTALPPLGGLENIRDFIACIAQAILLEVIDTADASKLLYAAQVAIAASRVQPASVKSRAS